MVAFMPQEEGTIEQRVVLACDNQTSQVFTIKGTGSMLTMRLHKLDGKELEDDVAGGGEGETGPPPASAE